MRGIGADLFGGEDFCQERGIIAFEKNLMKLMLEGEADDVLGGATMLG